MTESAPAGTARTSGLACRRSLATVSRCDNGLVTSSGVGILGLIVGLGLATVFLVGVGERFGLPYPVLVLVLGAVVALAPGIPSPRLDPDLILPIFLPPLIFAAVRRTSWPLIWARRRTIVSLAFALVVVTTIAVAGVVSALLPTVSAAAAVAFGALVSPPDPVAAEAVAGRIHLPRRLESILQTEGLCNDATALVVYSVAVSGIGGAEFSVSRILVAFVYEIAAALAIGLAIGKAGRWLLGKLGDPNARSGFTLVVPFGTFLLADVAHASGVLAVLTVALMLGSSEAEETGVSDRLIGGAFWDTLEMLVTGIAFGLMGLELRAALDTSPGIGRIFWHMVIICLVVIAVRFAWLLVGGPLSRRLAATPDDAPRNWREDLILSWAGMRGLATIAPALALPADTPARGELIFSAFAVITATLVIPGLTLPMLTRALGVTTSDEAEQARLRPWAKRAATAALDRFREIEDTEDLPDEVLDTLRERLRGLAATLSDAAPGDDYKAQQAKYAHRVKVTGQLHADMLSAARQAIVAARAEPGTDPKAADDLLRRLDLQSARFEL
jgi:Na+/H+ antiporter